MAAPKQVSDNAVRAVLERWRGNVKAAADEVHMKPDNLRTRARQMGIDLAALRAKRGTPHAPGSPGKPQQNRMPRNAAGGPESPRALYPKPVETPTLASVSSAVPEFARRGDKPIRVLPDHGDRIRRGRRQLSAEMDIDLDETGLLALFVDERWDDWLSEQVDKARRARTEGEDEKDE